MKNTCIRINKESLDFINQLAENKKRKPSEMIRLIIEDYIDDYNKKFNTMY